MRSLARWALWATFTALSVGALWRHGTPGLRRPETVISNTVPALRASEPFLRFLLELEPVLPDGATVAVVGAGGARLGPTDFLIAVGQLPRQSVARDAADPAADHVAVFGRPLRRAGLVRERRLRGGVLYRVVRSGA